MPEAKLRKMLKKYAGREDDLIRKLEKKYAKEALAKSGLAGTMVKVEQFNPNAPNKKSAASTTTAATTTPAASAPAFIPSTKFDEDKPGYYYSTGASGPGYYKDEKDKAPTATRCSACICCRHKDAS